MASPETIQGGDGGEVPQVLVTAPSIGLKKNTETPSNQEEGSKIHRRRFQRRPQPETPIPTHIRLESTAALPTSPASSIYKGSYGQSPRRSRVSLSGSLRTPGTSTPVSPSTSIDGAHLEELLGDLNLDLKTYGVEELRDGFFDASFYKPQKSRKGWVENTEHNLPDAYRISNPLSVKHFFPRQWKGIIEVYVKVTTTRDGIKLLKSFSAFFISYILCLIPAVRVWMGRYNYIIVLSTLFNHPGRSIGAQLDGTVLTISGSAAGLLWGAAAIKLSDSTAASRRGYGGVLATLLVIFMGSIAALRSYYIRVYQFVLCAGMAAIFMLLVETSDIFRWVNFLDYGKLWLMGQAICLLICCTVFPDAGARPLAVSLHKAFAVMGEGLILPHQNHVAIHDKLARTFVDLSMAHRDLVLDISITRFKPQEVTLLRNKMQAMIRAILCLRAENNPFEQFSHGRNQNLDNPARISMGSSFKRTAPGDRSTRLVSDKLADPTLALLSSIRISLASCDAVLMDMSSYRKYLGPPEKVSSDVSSVLSMIRSHMKSYDEAEDSLMENSALPPTYSDHPEVVELLLFVHPIRQAATCAENLLMKVVEMQQNRPKWRPYWPLYPLNKSMQRTNAQVRHDRGGLTAGFFFRSQAQLAKTMKGMANVYKPLPRQSTVGSKSIGLEIPAIEADFDTANVEKDGVAPRSDLTGSGERPLRFKLWLILHRLQGFETRFALKVALVTGSLSIPAWLPQSRTWWNQNESWWAVVMVWIMLHPRVGGNFQDLVTRSLCGILGAFWGAITYRVGSGNPYVMAVFAAIYMIPMIYRFTQSTHPRSGIVGCVSFVVISLAIRTTADQGPSAIVHIAWTRGIAIVVGVVAAVVVNWVLWPFVARHELRKALSGMMIYSSIIYRGIVARYVYYDHGQEPSEKDIERSEMLEGRLREGFVRIEELMTSTQHEIRLRGPFNHHPYSSLIEACKLFFEYLISVRQSSLFFHPHYLSDDKQAAESLLAYRRDAVAAILMNLYILAGALRSDRKVPRYLPSAAAARKRLLEHMAEIEAEQVHEGDDALDKMEKRGRTWAQIYSHSYSEGLTGCVKQLEQLQRYTKEIVGEQGFDPITADFSGYNEDNEDAFLNVDKA